MGRLLETYDMYVFLTQTSSPWHDNKSQSRVLLLQKKMKKASFISRQYLLSPPSYTQYPLIAICLWRKDQHFGFVSIFSDVEYFHGTCFWSCYGRNKLTMALEKWLNYFSFSFCKCLWCIFGRKLQNIQMSCLLF